MCRKKDRHVPEGPAMVFLRIAAKHPDALLDMVREQPSLNVVTRQQ